MFFDIFEIAGDVVGPFLELFEIFPLINFVFDDVFERGTDVIKPSLELLEVLSLVNLVSLNVFYRNAMLSVCFLKASNSSGV